jgi:hypothetical protein
MKPLDRSIALLGLGSVAFGVWGLVHPKSLTRLMGDEQYLGRPLGIRDLAVGAALLKYGGTALPLRIASDVHDAIRLRQRSPLAALGAAAVAMWGVVALSRD